MTAPTREELDRRLAATADLGHETKGASSADEIARRQSTRTERPSSNGHTPATTTASRPGGPTFMKASELMTRELPQLKWAIPGIQPAGLTLLVGRPKLGKSSLISDLGVASAAGGRALGRIQVEAADTHLSLCEDTERRVKSRLELQLEGAPCPERLTISTSWPRLDQGGLEWAEAWGKKHPGGRIWFDTFAKIRPASSRNGSLYQDDYAALAGLQTIAGRYELAIGVVHHTRKMTSDDPLETISGTQGLAAAADTILILRRERAHRDAVLFVTGRDVEEAEVALRFDPARFRWAVLGDELSEERLAVIRVLRHADQALGVKEISLALGRSYESARVLCWRMGSAGQILVEGKARYAYNPRTPETPETDSTSPDLSVSPVSTVSPVSFVSGVSGVSGVQQDGYGNALMQEPDLEEEPDETEPAFDPDELSEVVR
jgi:AAA domain